MPSRLAAELDADEFDGDLAAADVLEPVIAAPAAPLGGSSAAAAVGSYTPAGFEAPNHANILATALGFLLFWSHAIWFLETALCFCYLRYARITPQAQRAPVRLEPVSVPVDDSTKKQFDSAAAGLQQRRSAASSSS